MKESANPKDECLQFFKMSQFAISPLRATPWSAGLDLFSAYDYVIPARGQQLCKTDIQIELPLNCYGRIAPRSGLALKSIDVGAGVIDSDYKKDVGVLLYNFSDVDYEVSRGDRIAQLICEKCVIPKVVEVYDILETLYKHDGFGHDGFGSTGK